MALKTVIFDGTITVPTGYASSKNSKQDREKNTKYQALPTMGGRFILPGEQLAGALRRAGMNDIRAAYEEEPLQSILSYYQAAVGGIAGFGQGYKYGELAQFRANNPFVSLWGKAGVRGHIGMGHAEGPVTQTFVPRKNRDGKEYEEKVSHSDRVHGFRSDDLARDSETDVPVSFWVEREVLKYAGKSPDTARQVAAHAGKHGDFWGFPVPAEGETLTTAEGQPEENGDSEKGGKLTNIQNGYGGFEYLPNGTRFTHRFTVTGTKKEILMLMASFHGFARYPRLGGHWRHNLGWVDMQYTVYLQEDDLRLAPREVGTLAINSHMGDLEGPALDTTGMVADWMDQYLAWRKEEFSGMDINAGVEKENQVILANLLKLDKDSKKAAGKKKKAASEADEEGQENVA